MGSGNSKMKKTAQSQGTQTSMECENLKEDVTSASVVMFPSQKTKNVNVQKETQQQSQESTENVQSQVAVICQYEIHGINANDIFKYIVTTFGGGCTFEKFFIRCKFFPEKANISLWFEKHTSKFRIFKDMSKLVYILPYLENSSVCFHYNNVHEPGVCKEANCTHFHICRRSVRNNACTYKKCTLAHDFTNEHNLKLKKQLELDTLQDNHIKNVLNSRYPAICKTYYFAQGHCRLGVKKCPHLHFCGLYKFGNCKEPCKLNLSHNLHTEHNGWVLNAFEMRHWPEEKIKKKVYVPSKTSQDSDSSSSNEKPRNGRNVGVIDAEDSDCDEFHKGSDFVE
ncbi:uncharacterized protein LOC127720286 isoform X2 [Mytilus californianus]|uniref:uncharacterized protein LOC127720286 isoform X2 n=1 Tax=Mytilus californianus TaxID=6549 RepID=UPI0022463C20|nr:uncharacterized protein LOC127720286 isoform X2 [Mytilus californianus]